MAFWWHKTMSEWTQSCQSIIHAHVSYIIDNKLSLNSIFSVNCIWTGIYTVTDLWSPMKISAAEQDVHLPRQRVWVAWRLQLKAAVSVPKCKSDDQYSAPWRQHQQLLWTVYPFNHKLHKHNSFAKICGQVSLIGKCWIALKCGRNFQDELWSCAFVSKWLQNNSPIIYSCTFVFIAN